MADVKKVTKKDMFNEVIALAEAAGRQDVVEFAEREIKLLAKRNSADSKAKAKKAEENAALGEQMVEFLAGAEAPQTTLNIATAVGVSTQKASPILKALEADGRVVKSTEKRKVFYTIAA